MSALLKGPAASRQARTSRKRNRKKRPAQSSDWFVNFLMLGLSVLVLSFVWSFWNRHANNQMVAAELNVLPEPPSMASPETLIAAKKYPNVTVEILNGCGVSGLAAEFKEIVQDKTFDVQHTENADNFKYTSTIILARSDNTEAAFTLATELGLEPTQVSIAKDDSRRVDVTLIVGHDYEGIPAYKTFDQNI
jgi:hypothetical protein